jgi:multidrug efflux system membrane fusion protein
MNIKATVSSKPWILAILVFVVVAIWMATGMNGGKVITTDTSQISSPGGEDAILKVQAKIMNAEPISRRINVYGRTAPSRTVTISAETEGRVALINTTRGVTVKAGEPLLELDMRDRQARLGQSRASVTEHRTAYQAQLELKKDGYISDTDITQTLAKLEAAKAELVRAQLDLENRVIRAPFDGVLQEREVEVGDFVRSGDPVATFVDNMTLVVTGTLAEQEIGDISVGDEARANLVTGQSVIGHVRYLSPVANESTRTFPIEVEIDNSAGDLPAGVTAEMVLTGGESLAQKISPALLTLDPDGTIGIFILDEFQRAQFVPVKIEQSETDGVWISGLPAIANVITVGQGYVSSGQLVETTEIIRETAVAAESSR